MWFSRAVLRDLKLGLSEEEADEDAKQLAIALVGDRKHANDVYLGNGAIPGSATKAQKELDSVIGDRLPTFEDRAQLGYIDRIIQDTLRWHPVTSIAVTHTCFEDDVYKGYLIPKGAIVAGNVWFAHDQQTYSYYRASITITRRAMSRDKTVYKDPDVFEPDRFLGPSTPPSPVFGWGRRRCPGNHFAQTSLFMAIASILMTFDIGVVQEESGNDIYPSGKLVNSLVLTPEQFPLKLTPRSLKHEELIRQSFWELSHM